MIIYRNKNKECELIPSSGTWLNVLPDIDFAIDDNSFTLDIDDILILYTDGIVES